jgi:hypothetical protein
VLTNLQGKRWRDTSSKQQSVIAGPDDEGLLCQRILDGSIGEGSRTDAPSGGVFCQEFLAPVGPVALKGDLFRVGDANNEVV